MGDLDMIKKIFKYIIIALVVAISTKYIPVTAPTTKEIIMISLISAVTFAFLDMYTPVVKTN